MILSDFNEELAWFFPALFNFLVLLVSQMLAQGVTEAVGALKQIQGWGPFLEIVILEFTQNLYCMQSGVSECESVRVCVFSRLIYFYQIMGSLEIAKVWAPLENI